MSWQQGWVGLGEGHELAAGWVGLGEWHDTAAGVGGLGLVRC